MGSTCKYLSIVALVIISYATECHSQARVPVTRAWADSIYEELSQGLSLSVEETISITDSLISFYGTIDEPCKVSGSRIYKASQLERMGELDAALELLQNIQNSVSAACQQDIETSIILNQTSIYLTLGDWDRVDSLAGLGIEMTEGVAELRRKRSDLMNNQAIARAYSGDVAGARRAFSLIYREAVTEGDDLTAIDALMNIGTIYAMVGEIDSASHAFQQCAEMSRSIDDVETKVHVFSNFAGLEMEHGRYSNSIAYLDTAYAVAFEAGLLEQQASTVHNRAEVFHRMGESDSSYFTLQKYLVLRDSVLNEEQVRALADVREKYETEKKAKENIRLKAENLEVELENSRVQRARNIYLFSGIGILLIAGGLWSRLRFVNRAREAIQAEKDVSEGLLHNILPEEVAAELKEKGYADACEFEKATILFTDFKGFTSISEQLTPAELVAELNHCFKAFDELMDKYQIEKIKTIGDAYMAAGGLPDVNSGPPVDVVRAALEMQSFMKARKKARSKARLPAFEMRVGIHTGPVVAGIVGVKKFQYDIWGDSVNTAARMESSGTPGEVNISEQTYSYVKNESGLRFEARGKIEAKGKGELEMYFVRPA